MLSRLNRTIVAAIFAGALAGAASAQNTPQATPAATPAPSPTPTTLLQGIPKASTVLSGKQNQLETAEQVAEMAIFFYGFPGYVTNPMGRERLNQIRKTTLEKGRTTITAADGRTESANYQRFVIRGESLFKEKIRLDQDFPSAKYSLVSSADKIFGIYNNTVFTPREDASKTFENQIVHGLEALLRYKENESTIALAPREKIMGVDYYVLDVTDKLQRKTRFFISVKTFHVMILTYEEGGVSYKRRFYDYNSAQGTLVPFRTVLWANDKEVEETEVGTITFGQKVDDALFNQS